MNKGKCLEQWRDFPVKASDHYIGSAKELCESDTWFEYISFPSHCACVKVGQQTVDSETILDSGASIHSTSFDELSDINRQRTHRKHCEE